MRRFLFGWLAICCATTSWGAQDPIKWSLNHVFPSTVAISDGSHTVVYTFANSTKHRLARPLFIKKSASPKRNFQYIDNCTGKRLDIGKKCTVKVILNPTSAGLKKVQLTIAGYSNNKVILPQLSTTASAAPVVNISGQVTQTLPSEMQVGSSSPFSFSYTNSGSQAATGIQLQVNVPHYSTNCGTQLNAGRSCEVSGTYTPTSATPTTQTVTTSLDYNQGPAVVLSTSTEVVADGLSGKVDRALPALTVANQNYEVAFKFSNRSTLPIPVSQQNTFTNFTVMLNSCPDGGFSLAPKSSCQIRGIFNAAVVGDYTLRSELIPETQPLTSVVLTTSTWVKASLKNARTIDFINKCDFPVWFSLSGGALKNSPTCQTTADCPAGTLCNQDQHLCFWENYGPTNNVFRLQANGGTNEVTIPVPPTNSYAPNLLWSGAISASLDCDGSQQCAVADCANAGGSTSCAVGVGFGQPATQAEITFLKNNVDSYDVEVINGFHVPIQLKPRQATASDYSCGSPGAASPIQEFGACNWNNAIPPSDAYYWVTKGGRTCTSQSNCASGTLCGLDISLNHICGNFLGFWTANEACQINASAANTYFNCNQFLPSPYPENTYTLNDLYACKTPNAANPLLNSCYLSDATTACCGCANWQALNVSPKIQLPPSPTTQNCVNQSATWVGEVQNTLVWMKQICPTYYVYPYDDKSSSFTCSNAPASSTNTVGYQVTFCAGGYTGLPSGVIDGRD